MNIFVSNLSYSLSESELHQIFSSYGQVQSVKIIKDRETNRSRGFGFVEMNDDNEAQNAIDHLNSQQIKGRSINVAKAQERSNRD